MNRDEQVKVYLMQSVSLANYAKLCIKLNEVPRIKVINQLENCEDVKKLHESNKIILDTIKQLDDLDKM